MGRETVNEAIAKRKSIRSFGDEKVESENVKSYSIVGIGYPAEDANLWIELTRAGFTIIGTNKKSRNWFA